MTKIFNKLSCVNGIITFQSEVTVHGRTKVKCRPSQSVIQRLHYLESKFVNLWVCSVNVGTLRGRPGETEEMLGRRSVDILAYERQSLRKSQLG